MRLQFSFVSRNIYEFLESGIVQGTFILTYLRF
jgi:hypothetical protein